MDNLKTIRLDSTQTNISELRQQLPMIARCINADPKEVTVVDYSYWPWEYMWTDFRDKVIERHGVLDDMPFLTRRSQQSKGIIGIGICVYESRLSPNIKYAVWTARGQYGDESYLVANNKHVFKLMRNTIRLNKEAGKIINPPILSDGILEEMVQNTVGFLLKAREIENFGVKIKRGIILDGSPGNGKTMLCRHIQKLCSQNNIRWGVITSADIDSAYEEKSLNDLFRRFTVTFFDDIDVAYMDRNKGNGKMACSLLTAMDGMTDKGHLVRIFTTNESVSELDPAFTRPGRIDKCITLEKPDVLLRRKLVETNWPIDLRSGINIDDLLEKSEDFSFAQLEAIRTFLVTNKILGDGSWDLTKAFDEFNGHRAENKRRGKSVGFQK